MEETRGARPCVEIFHFKYPSLSLSSGREFILKKAECITVPISSNRA